MTTSSDRLSASLDQVWHFFAAGGWYMLPIVLCSLAAATVVIFKALELTARHVMPRPLCSVLEQAATAGLPALRQALRAHPSVLSHICNQALRSTHRSQADAERATEAYAREEISRLERGIPTLEVLFTIAPMVGLIGTVSGLVTIFRTFGARAAGPDQAALISQGISEALNTTIAGLAVAVPCYFFQSYFSRRLETMALRMSTLTLGLIHAAYAHAPGETDAP